MTRQCLIISLSRLVGPSYVFIDLDIVLVGLDTRFPLTLKIG